MVTLDTVADFLSCGTYLHVGSLWLTILFYLWVGVWEETTKFGFAKLVRRWTEEPLFLSALAFGIWELGLRLFLYGNFSYWMLFSIPVHVLMTRASGKWWKAVVFHMTFDIYVTSPLQNTFMGIVSLGVVAYSVYYFIVNFPGKKYPGSACSS